VPSAALGLREIEPIKGDGKLLAGNQLSLADLYLFPIIFYLMMTPEKSLVAPHRGLTAWWEAMSQRSSVKKTQPDFG
jgi:glutathione S-transferase